MTISLYYVMYSPPCRAVLILARQLGIKLNLINVDLPNKEQLTPNYQLINPIKQVPCLDDDGFRVSESRVIMSYLISQYSHDNDLYPMDAKKRANIDRVLYLTAELWERFKPIIRTPMRQKKWPPSTESKDHYFELLKALELLSAERKFLAGDAMSLADISFICDITAATDVLGMKISHITPSLASWSERMKTALPEYDELIAKPNHEFKLSIEKILGRRLD